MQQLDERCASLPVRISASRLAGGGDGCFSTAHCPAESLVFSDVPLCWLPAAPPPLADNCASCGAFLTPPHLALPRLAGHTPRLPPLDEPPPPPLPPPPSAPHAPPPHACRRAPPAYAPPLAAPRGEQPCLAAQLLWRREAAALAAPSWREVCDAEEARGGVYEADDPTLPESTLAAAREALEEAAAAEGKGAEGKGGEGEGGEEEGVWRAVAAVKGEGALERWSRALGAVARNAIWVQIPNPIVFYLATFDEKLRMKDPECVAALPHLAAMVRSLQAKVGEPSGESRGRKRPREEGGEEGEEEGEEEEDGEEEGEEEGEEGEEEGEEEEGEEEDGEESDDSLSDDEEALHFSWPLPPSDEKQQKPSTLQFSSTLFPAHKGTAVYPLLSKLNHSCAPNCFVVWSSDNCAQLVTKTDVPPDTELTIDYLGDKKNIEPRSRRKWLEAQYGFTCVCEVCEQAAASLCEQCD